MTKPGRRAPSRFRTTSHPAPTASPPSSHGPLATVRRPPRRDSAPVEVVALPGVPRTPGMGEIPAMGVRPRRSSIRTNRRGKIVALPKPSISKLAANPGKVRRRLHRLSEPGLERALSGDDLRRCLPKPVALQRLPVLFCLRRQIPAHRRTRCLAAGGPHRRRSDNGKAYVSDVGGSCPATLGKET